MLKWNGNQILSRIDRAAISGLNKTASQSAIYAKRNHQGWRNRTGKAEGSIGVHQTAMKRGSRIFVLWGSRNVEYMLNLETRHGSALRNSASVNYRNLPGNIRAAFNRGLA